MRKGIEHIDESKCIYCGKCLNACPFGAIFEISQVFDVLHRIRKGEQVVAIVAPSILGQFKTTIEQVYGALKQVGFTDVIEVAQGAMDTVSNEAHELIEKLEEGQKFMTTSCCPSYIELVNKHIPAMKPYVSGTGSPMYYAARIAKEKYPDAKVVFIGPCVAKRKEAQRDRGGGLYHDFRGGGFRACRAGYSDGAGKALFHEFHFCARGAWFCAGRRRDGCRESLSEGRGR